MKQITPAILLLIIIFSACHKEKGDTPPVGYRIEITKGNNQTDTLGNVLPDSIIVKVTKDGILLKNVFVDFETTGCEKNPITEVPVIYPGQARFQWRLNGNTGKQILKITLLDSLKTAVDSAVAEATGVAPVHGWYRSSCTPLGNPIVNGFCKLSTGRLIAVFNTFDYPYYSDDNAITWHPLSSFPHGSTYLNIVKIIATSSDEIFAATLDNGLYYSPDGGQTWTKRSSGITDPRYFSDFNYTRSGKLLYSTDLGGVYLSEDKGVTWNPVMTGLSGFDRYYYPCEQTNGDLYLVNDGGDLYKSTNNGQQWTHIPLSFTTTLKSLFIDDNGTLYAGATNNHAELYKSADNGANWSKIYTATDVPGTYMEIHKMSHQSNGMYYFYAYGIGLVSTADFKTFTNINGPYINQSRAYITDKKGNLVIGTPFNGIYYNLP